MAPKYVNFKVTWNYRVPTDENLAAEDLLRHMLANGNVTAYRLGEPQVIRMTERNDD